MKPATPILEVGRVCAGGCGRTCRRGRDGVDHALCSFCRGVAKAPKPRSIEDLVITGAADRAKLVGELHQVERKLTIAYLVEKDHRLAGAMVSVRAAAALLREA